MYFFIFASSEALSFKSHVGSCLWKGDFPKMDVCLKPDQTHILLATIFTNQCFAFSVNNIFAGS